MSPVSGRPAPTRTSPPPSPEPAAGDSPTGDPTAGVAHLYAVGNYPAGSDIGRPVAAEILFVAAPSADAALHDARRQWQERQVVIAATVVWTVAAAGVRM